MGAKMKLYEFTYHDNTGLAESEVLASIEELLKEEAHIQEWAPGYIFQQCQKVKLTNGSVRYKFEVLGEYQKTEEPMVLTPEQIEAAALIAQSNFGLPDEIDIIHMGHKDDSDLDLKYKHVMQMAAISSVSLANTKKSLALISIDKESEFWSPAFDDVKAAVEREMLLIEKVTKLKQLLLLTDPAVSEEQMNDLTMKQWDEFVKAFPDEGTT